MPRAYASGPVARNARVHPRELLGRRLGLALLPFGIVHAVDRAARFFAADRLARLGRSLLDPVGEAVAAEAGQAHQVDILRILPMPQMGDQPAEGGGGDFVVDPVHDQSAITTVFSSV